MKHQEHIVCIKSDVVSHHENGFVEYDLTNKDLMLGQRASLEQDPTFRQVLPVCLFTCEGKFWTYERASSGGESRLHNKIATLVGGHWDMADMVLVDGVIDLSASLQKAVDREISEEVKIGAKIKHLVSYMICADDTEVDRHHIAMVWECVLEKPDICSAEDDLISIGFKSPEELLEGEYNLETWARISCEILIKDNQENSPF